MSGQLSELEDLQESYLFGCAVCGYEQRAKPSIFMHMGINSGSGCCLECTAFLHLEVRGDVIVSRVWDEWLAEVYPEGAR